MLVWARAALGLFLLFGKNAFAAGAPRYRVPCVVILQTRPDRLYCYSTNKPFRVILSQPQSFAHGEEFIAEGNEILPSLNEPVPTMVDVTPVRLGRTNPPPPIETTPGRLASDPSINYCRVKVRGRVTSYEGSSFLGRHIEIIVVQGVDGEFRIEVLNYSEVRKAIPLDSEIEVVGLSFVETYAGSKEAPDVSVDIENVDECRVVQPPSWFTLGVAKRLVAGSAGLVTIGLIWFVRERRQIGKLRNAEKAVRHLNLELENRIDQRTTELRNANARLKEEVAARGQAEDSLRVALAAERELNELKSRVVSTVSHEFRTPLGTIMSSAEILKAYSDRLTSEEKATHLNDIFEATRHMALMVEEVLVLGRIEAGKMVFKPAALDLAGFCGRIADEVTSATHGRCRIECHVPGQANAWADEALLRHIFINLLTNAVKYSPAGSVVEFRAEAAGADALFVVRDRGIGIPETDARQLYTAFHRGRNVGETPGSGLGLVIVKSCVELHRGQIEFESRENEGTTFRVSLPAFPGEIADTMQDGATAAASEA